MNVDIELTFTEPIGRDLYDSWLSISANGCWASTNLAVTHWRTHAFCRQERDRPIGNPSYRCMQVGWSLCSAFAH